MALIMRMCHGVDASFVTFHRTAVHDVRLVALFRTMQFIVVFYIVVIQMVLSHRYAAFEVQ